MIHVAELESASDPDNIPETQEMKTIAIVGGTGQTGKWAVKGALLRGYKVKILARSPEKVDKILATLFDEADVEKHKANVEVIKGGVRDEEAIAGLLTGAEVVLSFLGMVEPPKWIVNPGVEKLVEGLKKVAENGGVAPKLISMSALGIADSRDQMKAANAVMGRLTLWLVIPYMIKECYADLEASEKTIMKEAAESDGKLNMMVIRAPILKDNKSYVHDYAGEAKNYNIILPSDCDNISSVFIDRQQVAAGFLDCVESRQWDGKIVTVARN